MKLSIHISKFLPLAQSSMAMKSRKTLPGKNESSALTFQQTYYENLQIPRYDNSLVGTL